MFTGYKMMFWDFIYMNFPIFVFQNQLVPVLIVAIWGSIQFSAEVLPAQINMALFHLGWGSCEGIGLIRLFSVNLKHV